VSQSRREKLEREYDVVVIGGGFHGACAFEEAAARGYRVLLLERGDFCSGASANSLKTVHGGIRYLQSGDIRRMLLTARARHLWALRAPRLVRRLPCVAPLPRKFAASAPFVRLGAIVYNALTMNRRRGVMPELALSAPGVASRDIYRELASPLSDPRASHGLTWDDYQVIDSERLVMDTIRLGEQQGGTAVNYAEALDVSDKKGNGTEISVHDHIADRVSAVRAETTVAFTGSAPGDSDFLAQAGIQRSRPVLAVNVVIRRPLTERGVAFTSGVSDRADADHYLFCVPWRDSTIIGTWYWRAAESGRTTDLHRLADIDDVLRDINAALPGHDITLEDITRIHWGWLPGGDDETDDAEGSLLKYPLLQTSSTGKGSSSFVVMEGTKFTTANVVSLKGLEAAGLRDPGRQAYRSARSRLISHVVSGSRLNELRNAASSVGLSRETTDRLALQYGEAAWQVVEIAAGQPEFAAPIAGVPASTRSEIIYCVRFEQAMHLSDVIFRRTGIGDSGIPNIGTLECCADVMSRLRDWNESDVQVQIDRVSAQPLGGRWVIA
jgi:glycerol-3-phosphate dehydrogenase